MPRDLFGDVTDPSVRVGSRKWYTVPVSLAVHVVALGAVVIVPLLATGVLPVVPASTILVVQLAPPEPPPRPPRPRDLARRAADAAAAPVEAPDAIRPESGLEPELDSGIAASDVSSVDGISSGEQLLATPPPSPPVTREPVRPGGDIAVPRKIRDVPPTYPAIAQSARVEGTVIIQATIDESGRVVDATVLRSVPLLDQAALDAVRQWQYTPTRLNGVPVSVVMTVTVRFQLR